jgi:histidine triad (HIT) family protein
VIEPLSRLISGPQQKIYTKPDPTHTFRGRLDGSRATPDEVVYEDDDVFAFRHRIHEEDEHYWEIHVVVIPKKWIPTLLDMSLGDDHIWLKLLGAIQKIAFALKLYETGFKIRAGVLPPYQHTEHVHIHILAGKHTGADPDASVPSPV